MQLCARAGNCKAVDTELDYVGLTRLLLLAALRRVETKLVAARSLPEWLSKPKMEQFRRILALCETPDSFNPYNLLTLSVQFIHEGTSAPLRRIVVK
jgi:hypothetical protein